jgi:hypothetical protein
MVRGNCSYTRIGVASVVVAFVAGIAVLIALDAANKRRREPFEDAQVDAESDPGSNGVSAPTSPPESEGVTNGGTEEIIDVDSQGVEETVSYGVLLIGKVSKEKMGDDTYYPAYGASTVEGCKAECDSDGDCNVFAQIGDENTDDFKCKPFASLEDAGASGTEETQNVNIYEKIVSPQDPPEYVDGFVLVVDEGQYDDPDDAVSFCDNENECSGVVVSSDGEAAWTYKDKPVKKMSVEVVTEDGGTSVASSSATPPSYVGFEEGVVLVTAGYTAIETDNGVPPDGGGYMMYSKTTAGHKRVANPADWSNYVIDASHKVLELGFPDCSELNDKFPFSLRDEGGGDTSCVRMKLKEESTSAVGASEENDSFYPVFAPDNPAGETAEEAGETAEEAGETAEEAGEPAEDGGVEAEEAGGSAEEAGDPSEDGGVDAEEAGDPAEDGGVDAEGSGGAEGGDRGGGAAPPAVCYAGGGSGGGAWFDSGRPYTLLENVQREITFRPLAPSSSVQEGFVDIPEIARERMRAIDVAKSELSPTFGKETFSPLLERMESEGRLGGLLPADLDVIRSLHEEALDRDLTQLYDREAALDGRAPRGGFASSFAAGSAGECARLCTVFPDGCDAFSFSPAAGVDALGSRGDNCTLISDVDDMMRVTEPVEGGVTWYRKQLDVSKVFMK